MFSTYPKHPYKISNWEVDMYRAKATTYSPISFPFCYLLTCYHKRMSGRPKINLWNINSVRPSLLDCLAALEWKMVGDEPEIKWNFLKIMHYTCYRYVLSWEKWWQYLPSYFSLTMISLWLLTIETSTKVLFLIALRGGT